MFISLVICAGRKSEPVAERGNRGNVHSRGESEPWRTNPNPFGIRAELNTGQSPPENERRAHHKLALLEAALYVAGRPLDLNELCQFGFRSKKNPRRLRDNYGDYTTRSTALEILELKDERYVLQVKAEYTPL